ncbi:MAG: hypothetical protein HYV19_01210 [Gemmatimonadetes bacterium]|nr:hypothetical protein [Gemmatimonadota bacterium]
MPFSPRRARDRRGSALLLVLTLTLGFAALAMAAIYLTSSGGILLRLHERERDFRYAAEQALQQAKSRLNRDTAFQRTIPETAYVQLDTGRALTDAAGLAIPRSRVNTYIGLTGDTVGRFGQFVTVVSTAYDAGGTRHVRRLDLAAESFSRFAMFTNTWPGGLAYGTGEFIRGRAHSNAGWASTGSPGPTYFDTVSAVGSVTGTATYSGITPISGARAIPFPTVTKLAALPGYATQGNLNFTPVSGSSARATDGAGANVSGITSGNATRGTRAEFVTFDASNDGSLGEDDGFVRVFDLAAGMDTTRLRADLTGTPVALNDAILQNQCGAMKQAWVKSRIQTSTYPTVTVAQSNTFDANTRAGVVAIASLPTARCYPAGSPYLLLTERLVDATNCGLTAPNPSNGAPYSWAAGPLCSVDTRYGGQDTTFTPNPRTCMVVVSNANGRCGGTAVALGTWRQAPSAIQLDSVPAATRQDAERTYLFPLAKPTNLASKGVVHFTAGPIFVSGVLRGFVTLYVLGRVGLIDDLTYDQNPVTSVCRNFLGIIGRDNIMITDNSMNRPKSIATTGVEHLMGTPHYTLHAITMSLTGTVGVENYAGNAQTSPSITCGAGNTTSGGCINQTGGVIEQVISATYAGSGTGLRENRTVDPCQKTNRRPPFFPQTGRFLDNKYYELDPVNIETPAQIRALFNSLRGRSGL